MTAADPTLAAILDRLAQLEADRDHFVDVISALEDRVAELETRLAAAEVQS